MYNIAADFGDIGVDEALRDWTRYTAVGNLGPIEIAHACDAEGAQQLASAPLLVEVRNISSAFAASKRSMSPSIAGIASQRDFR